MGGQGERGGRKGSTKNTCAQDLLEITFAKRRIEHGIGVETEKSSGKRDRAECQKGAAGEKKQPERKVILVCNSRRNAIGGSRGFIQGRVQGVTEEEHSGMEGGRRGEEEGT